MQTTKVIDHIVNWLKDYAKNAKMNGFVVGVSGGIDSAVTSTLSPGVVIILSVRLVNISGSGL